MDLTKNNHKYARLFDAIEFRIQYPRTKIDLIILGRNVFNPAIVLDTITSVSYVIGSIQKTFQRIRLWYE